MLKVNELNISAADRKRLLDIKSRKLLGMHVSRKDSQWVLDVAARVKEPIPATVLAKAAKEGYDISKVAVA